MKPVMKIVAMPIFFQCGISDFHTVGTGKKRMKKFSATLRTPCARAHGVSRLHLLTVVMLKFATPCLGAHSVAPATRAMIELMAAQSMPK